MDVILAVVVVAVIYCACKAWQIAEDVRVMREKVEAWFDAESDW